MSRRLGMRGCALGLVLVAGACVPQGRVEVAEIESSASVPAREERTTTSSTVPPTTTEPPTTVPPTTAPPTTARRPEAPPPVAPPPARAAAPRPSCHPSYTGTCIPPDVADADCAGGSGDGPWYVQEEDIGVVGPDEFDLDRDNDGLGCESSN